jgi:hypothetical protein
LHIKILSRGPCTHLDLDQNPHPHREGRLPA